MTTESKPIEVAFTLTDTALYQLVMHSKSPRFGWSGKTIVRVMMAYIALLTVLLAFGLPYILGMDVLDKGRFPLQAGVVSGGLALVALYPSYARWHTRRSSAAYQTLPLPIKLLIDDVGIHAQLDGQSGATDWKLIVRAVETDSHMLLYLNRLRGYAMPKIALDGSGAVAALRAIIAKHVQVETVDGGG